jgi:hypothetical protein
MLNPLKALDDFLESLIFAADVPPKEENKTLEKYCLRANRELGSRACGILQ